MLLQLLQVESFALLETDDVSKTYEWNIGKISTL